MISVWRSSATSGSIISMTSYAFIPDHLLWTVRPRGAGQPCVDRSRRRDQEVQRHPGAGSCSVRGPSILVPVRRLGWFIVGAAGATGALIAAPGLYSRLREAVGAGDVWNDFEPEPDNGGYAAPREAEPEPVAEPEPEVVVEPEPEPSAEPELTVVADPDPEPEEEVEAEPEVEAVPETEPEPSG